MMELITLSSLAALFTLTLLEIVLGIDNLVIISILTGKLPADQQSSARRVGLGMAAAGRIVLLFAIAWVIQLEGMILFELPSFLAGHGEEVAEGEATALNTGFSLKDLIMAVGGAFLIGKATWEIHHNLEGGHEKSAAGAAKVNYGSVIAQIFAMDMIFSIDSVLTAVGMVRPDDYQTMWVPLTIMIVAIMSAVAVMIIFANPVGDFVVRHPTVKMLALSFMLMIGMVLVAEGFHQHIPRGYIYSAMAFSLFVETLNLQIKKKRRGAAAHAQVE